MALAETTLASAAAATDTSIVVASATSIAADRLLQVGGEMMKVTKGYVTASTTVPVSRGQSGTAQQAHVTATRVIHGDAADWGAAGAGTVAQFAPGGRVRRVRNYQTTASMDLPAPGEDMLVIMHGSAFTLTVPVPTKDLDGCVVIFAGVASAAYVLEFTGGLNGAGAGYETITNASSSPAFMVIAVNETWRMLLAGGLTGTATNVVGSIG